MESTVISSKVHAIVDERLSAYHNVFPLRVRDGDDAVDMKALPLVGLGWSALRE